jgi:triosephosphate isomerase
MTTRNKLFATWKNQVGLAQSLTLAAAAADAAPRTAGLFELSVCPSMTALAPVAQATAGRLAVTAQNLGWDDTHSLTGETPATDLADIGCTYVILGHSERRLYLGETNDMIARKLQTAFTHHLTPILCVGDTLEQHHDGRTEEAVHTQMEVLLRLYHRTAGPFLIAYEPAWAISTSKEPKECTPGEAGDRHSFIRSTIATELGADLAANTTLLYGGSVTAGNADSYFTRTDIDGALVGAASQNPASFQALVNAAITTYRRARPHTGPPSTADPAQHRDDATPRQRDVTKG